MSSHSASKPSSQSPAPPRGWQEHTANTWQAASVPEPRPWKECSPPPHSRAPQLTAARSSRSASASSGDRWRPAGEGGACNPAGRAWRCNESTAWAQPAGCLQHPTAQGSNFCPRAVTADRARDKGLDLRKKGLKIKIFWSLTACIYWRAEWTGSSKAVWHQSDNEL